VIVLTYIPVSALASAHQWKVTAKTAKKDYTFLRTLNLTLISISTATTGILLSPFAIEQISQTQSAPDSANPVAPTIP